MQGLVIQPVRLALGPRSPAWHPSLGQAVQAAPMTPPSAMPAMPPQPPAKAPTPLIDSALVSFIFDALGATASGILAYGAAQRKNKLSYLFGIMAGVLAFKGVADLNDIRER